MPLIDSDGKAFQFNDFKDYSIKDLVRSGVLPDVKGLYTDSGEFAVNGIIISHPHQDHYGLSNFVNSRVPFYVSEASFELLKVSSHFIRQEIQFVNHVYFENEKPFIVGDFTITPFLADHSGFDSYSFLVESKGNAFFIQVTSARMGGKEKSLNGLLNHAPQNVDYLLLEGTTIGRVEKSIRPNWKSKKNW